MGSVTLLGLTVESGQGRGVALETFLTVAGTGASEYIQLLEGQDDYLWEPRTQT